VQIDWVTVIAQVVNFLVLVWLLKRFLYAPVLRAMDAREQRIAERMEQARAREADAAAAQREFEERMAALERDREEFVRRARDDAQAQRQALLEEARAEIAAQRDRWRNELARDRDDFLKAVRRQLAESSLAVARRVLGTLADADLETRVVHVFMNKLRHLDGDSREAIAAARGPIEVRTAFELEPPLRSTLAHEIEQLFGDGHRLSFRHDPALVQGIELTAEGRRVGWSVGDYLQDLERSLDLSLRSADQGPHPEQGA
jgi:F-type H+-transporting ATPase subunit b